MPLFSRHSRALQAAYSDVKRRALEPHTVLIGTAGSVSIRTVNGRAFYYRQFYDALGKKRASYLGAVGDAESENRARSMRESIVVAASLVEEARGLARAGYVRADRRTVAVLAALANRGFFRGGAVLVGSHACLALLNDLGVRATAFRTEDVDVARAHPIEVTLGPDDSLETILAESHVPLLPVPGFGRKAPSTSFKAKGSDPFRVDLLVPAAGREVTSRPVPELRAHATALPYLAYLLRDPIEAVVLGREGVVPVAVPRPEVFALHKMLVANMRGETRDKRRKDLDQAALLVAVLAEDEPDAIEEAARALPRSARSTTRVAARRVATLLAESGHARGAQLLATAL
jgi:hypothetical protein